MSKIVRVLSISALLGVIGTVAACHTIEGVGKDVQEVGEGVEEAAEETRT